MPLTWRPGSAPAIEAAVDRIVFWPWMLTTALLQRRIAITVGVSRRFRVVPGSSAAAGDAAIGPMIPHPINAHAVASRAAAPRRETVVRLAV
jgi:hypothetical protein